MSKEVTVKLRCPRCKTEWYASGYSSGENIFFLIGSDICHKCGKRGEVVG